MILDQYVAPILWQITLYTYTCPLTNGIVVNLFMRLFSLNQWCFFLSKTSVYTFGSLCMFMGFVYACVCANCVLSLDRNIKRCVCELFHNLLCLFFFIFLFSLHMHRVVGNARSLFTFDAFQITKEIPHNNTIKVNCAKIHTYIYGKCKGHRAQRICGKCIPTNKKSGMIKIRKKTVYQVEDSKAQNKIQ